MLESYVGNAMEAKPTHLITPKYRFYFNFLVHDMNDDDTEDYVFSLLRQNVINRETSVVQENAYIASDTGAPRLVVDDTLFIRSDVGYELVDVETLENKGEPVITKLASFDGDMEYTFMTNNAFVECDGYLYAYYASFDRAVDEDGIVTGGVFNPLDEGRDFLLRINCETGVIEIIHGEVI